MQELLSKLVAIIAEQAADDGIPIIGRPEGDDVVVRWSDGEPTGIVIDAKDGWMTWHENGEAKRADIRNANGFGLNRSSIHLHLIEAFVSLTIPEHLRQPRGGEPQ